MKIKILLIVAILFSITVKSQKIIQGVVTYKKSVTEKTFINNKDKSPNFDKFKKIEEEMFNVLNDIAFELKFNENESSFNVINSLTVEENKFASLALLPDGKNFFYNTKNIRLSKTNIFGEDFLVTDEALKWELKSETKNIGSYACYKAIAIERRPYRGKMKNYPIIAWYCPEINVPYGPIGVTGLPGLILEVSKGKMSYVASKININPKEVIVIKKPTNGKNVTRKEMGEMISEAMGNFKKNKGY